MLFSKKIICKFIPNFVNVDKQAFITAINDLGMELEQTIVHPNNENLVIGKILSVEQHPNADKLHVCKVQVDNNTIKTIICGATNVEPNKYVVVCLENAKLFDGKVIQYREMRGVLSQGMLCSYGELTPYSNFIPENEQHCIITLDDAILGDKNWKKYINLDDEIYDVSIPANRNDLNTYFVFCKELANKLNLKVKKINFDKIKGLKKAKDQSVLKENIVSSFNLLTYDVDPELLKSSNWDLKTILMNHGIRPINKLLDELSYISLISGCPTNVYDANYINGPLDVKLANEQENFLALDNKTYTLSKNDIVVCNNDKVITLATIIGSDKTKLTNETKKIIIEIANFNYNNIRQTALRLNLQTTSAKIASKPLSNFFSLLTIKLINEKFGKPLEQSINIKPNWRQKPIIFSSKYFNDFVSNKISFSAIKKALQGLGFICRGKKIFCPQWRLDVTQQQDIVEEVLKIINMNSLEPVTIADNLFPISKNQNYEARQIVHNILLNNFFNEVKTYNLTNVNQLKQFNLFNLNQPYLIKTSNTSRQYLRNNLLPALLNVYKYNISLKHKLLPIYEIQNIYDHEKVLLNLTALCCDQINFDPISNSKVTFNVLYLKSLANEIAKKFGVNLKYEQVASHYFYHNESLAIIYDGKTIGYIGKINKSLLKPYYLEQNNIYTLCINLDEILKHQNLNHHIKSLSSYQQLFKDINFSIVKNKNTNINDFLSKLCQIENIVKVEIVSVFQKDNDTIYSIRYYLDDNKKYDLATLEAIYKKVNNLVVL